MLIRGNYVKIGILSADKLCVCVFRYSKNFVVIDCYGLLQTAHLYNLNNRIKESFEPMGKTIIKDSKKYHKLR